MSNVDLKSVHAFMRKVRSASNTGSKEIRLPIAEANELAVTIAEVMAINVQVSNQLRETEKLIGASVVIDGGRLGK